MAQPNQAAIPKPASSSAEPQSQSQSSSTRTNNRPSPLLRSNTNTASSSAISSTISSPVHTPRKDASHSPAVSHRSSFADNLRNYPPSPRAQRQPSFSGSALAELLMNPPSKSNGDDARFRGRDWRNIQVNEIIEPAEVRFVQLDTSIEDTTKLLVKSGAPNLILVRESTKTKTAVATFDYSDLNAYLLLVLGLALPDDSAQQLSNRARSGEAIPLADLLDHLGAREMPAFLPHTADLTQAMEVLGGGSHRLIICKEGTSEVVGIVSQLRLVRFFWENHQNFSATEALYSRTLRDLRAGAKDVVYINGDRPLKDALLLMHDEGITSLPVLDNQKNVVGNISHVDVKLLTDSSSIPLLTDTCIHFISIILSERGLNDGQDSYPVFHVTPVSTLAHTVAKLVATRSHRMWIVDSPSPAGSVPPSPGFQPTSHLTNSHVQPRPHSLDDPTHSSPASSITGIGPGAAVSAAVLPGQNMSGRLTGVVSLTDVLNLFARASGLSPKDPEEERQRRRRSSSSSLRPSMDSLRSSIDLGRSSSTSGGRR
ncbi:hypothetical protein Q7P36_006126 [Cladosporium allicinum]